MEIQLFIIKNLVVQTFLFASSLEYRLINCFQIVENLVIFMWAIKSLNSSFWNSSYSRNNDCCANSPINPKFYQVKVETIIVPLICLRTPIFIGDQVVRSSWRSGYLIRLEVGLDKSTTKVVTYLLVFQGLEESSAKAVPICSEGESYSAKD